MDAPNKKALSVFCWFIFLSSVRKVKISYFFVGAALAAIIVDQAAPTILFCNPCNICPDESSLVDKKSPS
jgi:hypothetical protein